MSTTDDMISVEEMKRIFYTSLLGPDRKSRAGNEPPLYTDQQYANQMEQVKLIKETVRSSGACEALFMYHNDVIHVNGEDRLILRSDLTSYRLYVTIDEVFDIIHANHTAVGHGVPRVPELYDVLKSIYANVTEEAVGIYLKLCPVCARQKGSYNDAGRNVTEVGNLQIAHAKINIVDMQPNAYAGYRYILMYMVDNSSSFTMLLPLKTASVEDIASCLSTIFSVFGVPMILQSDAVTPEFAYSVMTELSPIWPDVHIVQFPAKELEAEMANNVRIISMINTWMSNHKTSDWPSALKFIQFQINNSTEDDKTSQKIMSHRKPPFNLASENQKLTQYDHLPEVSLTEFHDSEPGSQNAQLYTDFKKPAVPNGTIARKRSDSQEIRSAGPVPIFKKSKKSRGEERISIGTKIWLTTCNPVMSGSISESQRSCLTILVAIHKDYYVLGNEKGIINYRFSRTQLNPCVANCKIKVDDNKRISLSEAFGLETDVPINLCEEKCYSSNCPCLENKNISNYNCLCFNSYLPSSNN